ncbi:hypothetical protein M422DRAFT_260629 [Sphaerobolus stellatus SS14]|uniref:Uncharacterized protein n=1 Tax=Sphaerobolus stellatus (strain SS14) TaxID=990650 RepID=A0A0C9VHG1_SPHS4|nr:hypothetical protein M422DRAFT_260629 [Sphaerobolus stellatus SS14]
MTRSRAAHSPPHLFERGSRLCRRRAIGSRPSVPPCRITRSSELKEEGEGVSPFPHCFPQPLLVSCAALFSLRIVGTFVATDIRNTFHATLHRWHDTDQ